MGEYNSIMPHKFSPTPLFRNVIVTDGGTVQINSAGNDKTVQIYHDDTNTIFKTSSGALYLQPGNNTIYGYDGTATYAFALYAGAALGVMLHGGANCYINNGNNFGVGLTDPDELVEFYKVGTQLKLSGGAADYATFAVSAAGALTITTVDVDAAEGNIILAPDGYVDIYQSTAHPILTITAAHATDYDPQIQFRTDASPTVKFSMGVDGADDKFKIFSGSGVGGSVEFTIDTNGAVTNSVQPAFLVMPYSQQTNVTGATIVWGEEIFDQGGDFANNVFTAPVTGKYQFNVMVGLGNIDTDATYYRVQLITSNRTFYCDIDPNYTADLTSVHTVTIAVLADMDASDTAYVYLLQFGGAAQTDIETVSYFSGALIC